MAEHVDTAEQLTEDESGLHHEDCVAESKPTEADDESSSETDESKDDAGIRQRRLLSAVDIPLLFGLVTVVILGAVGGWLGYRMYVNDRAQRTHDAFVEAARQGAVNLTTIDYARADADIQRILDSSTGKFRDQFQERSQPFADVVKQAKTKSEGTVTEAGVESQDTDQAQVLVAASVKTSVPGAPEQQPREWRMRITVEKVDDGFKVADLQFVP